MCLKRNAGGEFPERERGIKRVTLSIDDYTDEYNPK